MPSITNLSGLHIIVAVTVLGAIGEFAPGMIKKVAWSLVAVIAVLHTLRIWASK